MSAKFPYLSSILFMIGASFFFSIMGAFVKYTTAHIPVMEAVFFRAAVTLLLITPWMIVKKIPLIGQNKGLLLLRGAAGFTALSLSFYLTSIVNLADASIYNRTSVLFVALFSAFFLREKVTTPLVIYIICAFIGVGMIIKPSLNVVHVPGLIGLAVGLLAAIAYICVKALHRTETFFTIVYSFSLFSALGSVLLFHRQFIWPESILWFYLIGIGLFGTIAQLMMTYSYKHIDASVVTPYSFSTIFFSLLWGMFFWNEIPDLWSALGAIVMIACGVGIVKLKKDKGETAIEYGDDLADQVENRA